MTKINTETILSYFLGFVVMYFGVNEILSPEKWTVFVPEFLGSGQTLVYLVVLHGILLVSCGLTVVFNFYRRIAAGVLSLMIAQIVITMFLVSGLDEIVARDIGLLGMALALTLKN